MPSNFIRLFPLNQQKQKLDCKNYAGNKWKLAWVSQFYVQKWQ